MTGRRLQAGTRWLLAIAGIVLVVAALVVVGGVGRGEPALNGTRLDGRAAPDFTLTDQRGQTVRLSDFRGKSVALTFIYTNCPDVCPLTAENFRVAYALLSAEARTDVALVAVNLDPARDDQRALEEFSAVHRLTDNPAWFALRGDPAALEPVWQAYGIYPGVPDATPGLLEMPMAGGVGHTDGIYFLDRDGRERAFMRSSATPQEIAANLAAMLG